MVNGVLLVSAVRLDNARINDSCGGLTPRLQCVRVWFVEGDQTNVSESGVAIVLIWGGGSGCRTRRRHRSHSLLADA